MTEDIGRNDPCPCGSGKKYKKCCWREYREHHGHHERDADGTVGEQSFDDMDSLSWKQKLKRFRSMHVHEKFEFLRDCYRDPEEVGGDYFMELMAALFRDTARYGTHAEFQTLIEHIHEHRSDLLDEFGVWLDRWRMMSVLCSEDPLTDRDLQRFTESYGEDPDVMETVLWAFLYRGRNEDLRTVLPEVVSRLRNRNDLMPGAHHLPAEKGVHVELYHDANQSDELPEPDEWIESNRDRFEQYFDDLNEDNLASLIRHVSGRARDTWSPADFVLSVPGDASEQAPSGAQRESRALPEEHRQNYHTLGKQFLHYRNDQYGVPWSRAEMTVNDLIVYLLNRADRELGPRESFMEAERRRQRDEPPPQQKDIAPENLLLPDGETLKRYLQRQEAMLQKHTYRRVALYAALPEWLEFIEHHSLVTSGQVQDTMEDIRFLQDVLLDSLQTNWPDPLLLDHLEHLSFTTSYRDEKTGSGRSRKETDDTIRRLTEEIRMAEQMMYHAEDDEFFDWNRLEEPMQKLAVYGRKENAEPVRDAFRNIIQNCSSGVAFAFGGQYSILTVPDDVEPVLADLDERVQDDLSSLKDAFKTLKQQPDAYVDLSSNRFWFYLHQFFPYLFQFLRRTDRSMSPEYIDRILNELVPNYFDTCREIRTFILEEGIGPDRAGYFSFRSMLTSFAELLLTFYSALTGKTAGQLDHPKLDIFNEGGDMREFPEVPDALLKWIQVRWNHHRPDEGDWTPDPIEGDNPLKHIEEEWTFELSEPAE